MNCSAITAQYSLLFRQPLARNRIRFRLLAADGDLAFCQLCYWKRTTPEKDKIAEAEDKNENFNTNNHNVNNKPHQQQPNRYSSLRTERPRRKMFYYRRKLV